MKIYCGISKGIKINYKPILLFSGHSLRKKENPALKPNPKIKVSLVRPESLSLDLEDEESGSLRRKEPIIPRHHAQVLPDEITRELENLSHVDKERTSRIAKLEKWRKGVEDVLPVEPEVDEIEEQASKVKNNVLPESAESSVEGSFIYFFCLNGVVGFLIVSWQTRSTFFLKGRKYLLKFERIAVNLKPFMRDLLFP